MSEQTDDLFVDARAVDRKNPIRTMTWGCVATLGLVLSAAIPDEMPVLTYV